MLIYMVHPDHGTHIAYDIDEVERCKLNGWEVREDSVAAVNAVAEEAEKQFPKKRGRPKKVK